MNEQYHEEYQRRGACMAIVILAGVLLTVLAGLAGVMYFGIRVLSQLD